MDYTNWDFSYNAALPPIPETEYEDNWCQINQENQSQFLPFNEQQENRVSEAETTSITTLVEHIQRLQSSLEESREKTETQISALSDSLKKSFNDIDKLIIQMLKDIAALDRNYLKLMPWCYQIHEKITECIGKEGNHASVSTKT